MRSSIVLVLVLALTLVPVAVADGDEPEGGGGECVTVDLTTPDVSVDARCLWKVRTPATP